MDPNIKRRSVSKGVPFLLLGIAIIIGIAYYIYLNPGILGDLVMLAVLGVLVVVAAVAVIFAVTVILAIPFYIYKGEQYQDSRSYKLEDIKEVTGTSKKEDDR